MTTFSQRPMAIDEIEENKQRWLAVLARNHDADGTFVYAVLSTRVYCRPSCRARRPKRENVAFFDSPLAARKAGFRSCLLCHPDSTTVQDGKPITFEFVRDRQHLKVHYQLTPSSLGYLLVAGTDKGVCTVSLGDNKEILVAELIQAYPNAKIASDEEDLVQWVTAILEYLKGQISPIKVTVDINATAFQSLVWNALCDIPYACTRSYREIADLIGKPKAVRAVANACASNPVALVIPCHRVIRNDGGLGGYRWGLERKQTLLQRESENLSMFQQGISVKSNWK